MAGPGTPSHRSVDEPQPEICELCGTRVPGRRLTLVETEGLRGRYICDVTPGCVRFRQLSGRDKRRLTPRPTGTIGESRVYPAAQEDWSE
jgi:hypothetical protein